MDAEINRLVDKNLCGKGWLFIFDFDDKNSYIICNQTINNERRIVSIKKSCALHLR